MNKLNLPNLPNLPIKENWFWQSLILSSVVLLNLLLSWAVRNLGLYYIPNQNPFGFSLGILSSGLILLFVTWGIFSMKLFEKSPVFSLLILAGGWSNYIERIIFGSATDYIIFFFSYINLADIQIWLGLILLNVQVWFGSNKTSEETVEKN